jgi:glycerate dehydrogenase
MNIVVLDGYTLNPGDNPWTALEGFGHLTVHDRTPEDLIESRAADADILLTNKTPLSAETLSRLPKLRMISVLATGYNVVDCAAARARGIPVCNVPGYSTDSVAEFVMAMILDFFKQARFHSELVFQGGWQRCPDFCFWQNPHFNELAGKTIGIVGFGTIGQRLGELASAFRMRVLASSRSRRADATYPFEWMETDDLFARADIVSLHCPLTDETRDLVNKHRLSLMKPGAFLINTARGPLVVEQDLCDALNAGTIAGAACDVVSAEPIRADNPLLRARNLTLTPHIAWAALEARRRLMDITAANTAAFLTNNPVNVVNP